MKTYIYNIKKNNNYNINDLYTPEYTMEDLKTDINNGYTEKYSWWNLLKGKPKKTNKTYTFIPTYDSYNTYDNKKLYTFFINNLNDYTPSYDDYDFELGDGTPVKIYSDFIQVGYDIIPRNSFTYFADLTPKKKKTIIEIITKITIKK